MNRILLTALLLCLLPLPAFPATMPPVRMKVVDAQDGRPVAGAHVLFQANAHEGTFTGHGGRSANLFVAETVTDHLGDIHLPQQEFPTQPFFLNTVLHNPSMIVLKPGYALLILTNGPAIIPNLDEMTAWQYEGHTVRMKQANSDNDMSHALTYAASYAEMSMSERSLCAWRKFPRFLVAVDRLAAEWNRKRATLADTALRNKAVTSPLQKILMNDRFFVEKKCGSPKAFFEPYLR